MPTQTEKPKRPRKTATKPTATSTAKKTAGAAKAAPKTAPKTASRTKPKTAPKSKAAPKTRPVAKAKPHAVRIGTRGSPLAVAQAEEFAALLEKVSGGAIACTLHKFTTTGDKILDKPLQEAGGKGLFTKELDRAQKAGEIDVGVHSLKDVTTVLPRFLKLTTYLPREDPRDVLIGAATKIADLPEGAVIGSSSLRRRSQIRLQRPDLKVVDFRGNVQTRLKKLADGVADATLLACAGLNRLGRTDLTGGAVPIEDMLPAGGQGIVAATLRTDAPDWLNAACAALDDMPARLAGTAERAFLRRLDGSCRTPIAAHFRLTEEGAEMFGEVLAEDGSKRWRAHGVLERMPSEKDAAELGLFVAEDVAAQRAQDPE